MGIMCAIELYVTDVEFGEKERGGIKGMGVAGLSNFVSHPRSIFLSFSLFLSLSLFLSPAPYDSNTRTWVSIPRRDASIG